MAVYLFTCPFDGHEVEVRRPMAEADLPMHCPVHQDLALTRKFTPPLATTWAGRFGNRAIKVRDGEW